LGSDGYFACSIGDANSETIRRYIENQGYFSKAFIPEAEDFRVFCRNLYKSAALFYEDSLVPKLNEELSDQLGIGEWVSVDSNDEMIVNFVYPQIFETEYIIPHVRLEIGPLAEWMPSHVTRIIPFAAEQYEWLFERQSTDILTIDAERTFWEKITILHRIANFPDGKTVPYRYARHLYDVYCLGHSKIKKSAFEKKNCWKRMWLLSRSFTIQKVLITKLPH